MHMPFPKSTSVSGSQGQAILFPQLILHLMLQYCSTGNEVKALVLSVSTTLLWQSPCHSGKKCVNSMIVLPARKGHWKGIALSQALVWNLCTCQSGSLCQWQVLSITLCHAIILFRKAEDNQQAHLASVSMLLLGIYLDLQLIHLEPELSCFMYICGLRFVFCLAFTVACQVSWTSLWVPVFLQLWVLKVIIFDPSL